MSGWRDKVSQALAEPEATAPGPAPADGSIAAGLHELKAMRVPAIASPERWNQVLTDASALIADWADVLGKLGWSVSDVFGLDLAARHGDLGLIYAIRGGRVALIEERSAMIHDPDAQPRGETGTRLSYRTHFRLPDPPPPIWVSTRSQ